MLWYNICLQNRFPTNPAPTSIPFRLGIFFDGELASDQFRDIVNRAALDQSQGDTVDDNSSIPLCEDTCVSKIYILLIFFVVTRKLELVHIAVAATGFYRHTQA